MKSVPHITGIILAGGKSSRIGSDKGLLLLGKSLFIEHIINALYQYVDDIIIVSSNTNYDEFGVKRVEDIIKDSGPLAGLHTGLYYSNTDYNLVVSCDVPLINSSVIQTLIDGIDPKYEVVQLESQGETLPLTAIYKKACLQTCQYLLNKGEKRLRFALEHMKTKTIALDAEFNDYVKNINTTEQLMAIRDEFEH